MKIQNKNSCKNYCNNKFSINTLNKARNRRNRKYRIVRNQAGLDEYVFYSILNTDIAMELGIAASAIARSILALYKKLAADRSKNPYVVQWQKTGENMIVLQGYDHKHLKYLENEAKFVALGIHATYHRWYHNRVMVVLSAFGRKEDIEDIFDGLSYLR